jgi:hypothetical protein
MWQISDAYSTKPRQNDCYCFNNAWDFFKIPFLTDPQIFPIYISHLLFMQHQRRSNPIHIYCREAAMDECQSETLQAPWPLRLRTPLSCRPEGLFVDVCLGSSTSHAILITIGFICNRGFLDYRTALQLVKILRRIWYVHFWGRNCIFTEAKKKFPLIFIICIYIFIR